MFKKAAKLQEAAYDTCFYDKHLHLELKISKNKPCVNYIFINNYLHLPPRIIGAIAQLVEQRTENPCVAGSIPAGTTREPKLVRDFKASK